MDRGDIRVGHPRSNAALGLLAALIAVLVAFARPAEEAGASTARATAVARQFFRAMDDRRWDDVCTLLSHGFHERNNLTNERVCFLALHLGFTLRENVVFRLESVERSGEAVLVHALADGAPGVIRVIPEDGAYRIDSLDAEGLG